MDAGVEWCVPSPFVDECYAPAVQKKRRNKKNKKKSVKNRERYLTGKGEV